MILKSDCNHFPGDRPCKFNKADGIECPNCTHYETPSTRILIIKLDATGDVLRTTTLLPALHAAYPGAHITWITKGSAAELFHHNPLVHRVLRHDAPETMYCLMAEQFDLVIHPDASPVSAPIATLAKGREKRGFILGEGGHLVPLNKDAEHWLEMGAFDRLKQTNTRSYQEIIHAITELPFKEEEIQLHLSEEERFHANQFRHRHTIPDHHNIIGLNTGASGRWKYKQWTFDGYADLIEKLLVKRDITVMLYGGPEEAERNAKLKAMYPEVVDTGTNNTLRSFFSLLSQADIIVTGDTLALHAATALGKKVICLFGPTSHHEIYDYGRITKIYPLIPCLVCYKPSCTVSPNCMESISPETVFSATERLLALPQL